MSDPQSTVGAAPRITDPIKRQEEADFLLKHIEDSLEMRRPYISIWREIEDNILVRPTRQSVPNFLRYGPASSNAYFTEPSRPGYSILKDPESHQINETLVAQGLQILLGPPDYLTAVPRGYDDPEKARQLANMLMAIFDQPGNYGTMYRAFKDSFGYGISYLQIGWEERTRMQVTEVPTINPLTGQQEGTNYIPQEVLYRQQPRIDVIDHYDVYPDPNGTRIHVDMEFIAKRFRISPQQALDLARAGVYDMEATRRALAKHSDGRPGRAAPKGDERFEAFAEQRPRSTLIYGFEGYGRVPISYSDKVTNRFITMLNGEIVRSQINPFRDGEIPIVEIVVNPMTGRHYGFSPLEAVRYLQDSTDVMLMTLTDAADYMVRPNLLVGNFGGDPNALRRREANALIMCRDPKMVAPVPTDFNALTIAQAELARRKITMREASGATNPLQAIPTSDRATATEVSELTRLASQRIDVMVRLIERDNMPIIGRLVHSRLRQFIPPDSDLLAVLNGEPLTVPFEAINVDADVRFGGSRLFMSKFQRGAQMREFLNILGQFPQLLLTAPELVVKYGRDILGIEDAEPIVMKMSARQAAMMVAAEQQASAAASASGSPQGPESFGTTAGQTEQEGQAIA